MFGMQTVEPLKIGLINDIHYDGRAPAMNRLYEAIASLNGGGVGVLVVMGDLIDAQNEMHASRMLREVAALCDSFKGTVRFMPGNHDLDHLSKAQFYNAVGCAGETSYFSFSVGEFELVCIDGNYSADGAPYDQGNFNWQEAYVSDEQLVWLRNEIASAKKSVIMLSHQRIDKPCMHAVKNGADVREILASSGKVTAVFQGHQHEDDLQQVGGIPYYTLSAHKDDAGPAVVHLDSGSVRLTRDFKLLEPA